MTRARDLADGKHLTNVDTDTLVVDAANNRVGIGTSSPSFSNGSGLEVANATTACVRVEGNSAAHALEIYADSNCGTIDARGSGAVLAFDIGGSEKGRFLNGGGLTFNGDTAAANALDDYEEGTWTATFTGSSTTATGRYVKIGGQVFVTVYGDSINVTSSVTGTIGGLPFTNSGGYTAASITHDTYTNNSYNGYVNTGGTTMTAIQDGTVSGAQTVVGNPKYIMMSAVYYTTS